MRYFIEFSYNGKAYHGWQNQPNGITVQEVLEKALSTLLKSDIAIVGAGRTDAGVHALQMFAHFDTEQRIVDNLIYKLNSFLPKDIAIRNLFEVKPDVHARFHANSRSYYYKISTSKDVFDNGLTYQLLQDLDVDKMNDAAKLLLNYTDFECFSKTNTDVKTFNCDIKEAFWIKTDNNKLQFNITSNRFLRNMVRAIVGTLINVGLGKIEAKDLHTIIASKDRSKAGYSVPAQGLYLVKVEYPETIKNI